MIQPLECDAKRQSTKFVIEIPCADCGQTVTKEFPTGAKAVAWYSENVNRVCEQCAYKRLERYNG